MLWLNEVALWLVHSAVFGAIILLGGTCAVWFCREPVYRIRIIHWTLVASLLVPVLQQVDLIPSYSLNLWHAASSDEVSNNEASSRETALLDADADTVSTPAVSAPHDAAAISHVESEPMGSMANHEAAVPPEAMGATEASMSLTPVATPASNSFALVPLAIAALPIAYLVLVACLLSAWIVCFVRRGQIARHASPASEALRSVLASIAGRRARHARLLVTDRVDSPIMWGLWRPTIVIPAKLATAPNLAQLRWGLAHEWSHVRRRDFSTLLLASFANFVCFYQPAYWWLRRQLTLNQDYLADAFAAKHGDSAEDYAAFLVSLARARTQPTFGAALGIGARRSNLFQRVKMLVKSSRPPLQHDNRLPAIVITMIALLMVGGLSALRLSAEPKDDQPAATAEKKAGKQSAEAENKSPPKQKANDGQAKKLPKPLTYHGKVVDRETGKPIAGATVEVSHELSRDPKTNSWISLQTTTHKSDEKGNYSFTLPPEEVAQPSLYLVVNAHHPQYQSKGRSGYSHSMIRKNLANGEPPFYATIKLSGGEAISAVVLQPDGAPAANLQVLAYSKSPSKDARRSYERGAFQYSQTDESGRFRIVVATPGDGVLWVFPNNFSPIAHRIGDRRGDIGKLNLREGTRLSGRVLDAKGMPVANVGVNLRRNGDGDEADEFLGANGVSNAIRAGAKTDAEGRFHLNPLPPGTYRGEVRGNPRDPSERSKRRPAEVNVDHVFTPVQVTIVEGETNDPIEIRAVPHVILRGRVFNSQGKPRASHQQHLFGKVNGESIFAKSTRPGDDGWFEFKVPHGVEEARINLTTNEHSALRWRLKPDDPLTYGREVKFGTLEEDFTTLEVVRYVAPLLLLKAVDENGNQVTDFKPNSAYKTRPEAERQGRFISGALGDIGFEEQPDGRWRSSQLLPDEEIAISLEKEGFTAEAQIVTLKEKEERELVFVFRKAD